jgi:calcineurin-like phosphoesterase family protein
MDYVFTDPHFSHTKIRVKSRPKFSSDQEMNEYIVKQYNSVITHPNIKVYWLGDIGDKEAIKELVPKMKGYKILILGNHDKYGKSFYRKYFDEVHEVGIFYNKRILLSHHPMPMEPGMINVHGHTHLVSLTTGQHFNVCVEHTDYKPVVMKKFVDMLGQIPQLNRRFLQEWYKDHQKPDGRDSDDLVLTPEGNIDVQKTKDLWKTIKPQKVLDKFEKE